MTLVCPPRAWGVWFQIPTGRLILFVNWNFPACNGWRNRAWQPLSDVSSQSNWRNLSEDNEKGVHLKHHWKICTVIIAPKDSKYGSGKYRRLGRQTFNEKIDNSMFFALYTSTSTVPTCHYCIQKWLECSSTFPNLVTGKVKGKPRRNPFLFLKCTTSWES